MSGVNFTDFAQTVTTKFEMFCDKISEEFGISSELLDLLMEKQLNPAKEAGAPATGTCTAIIKSGARKGASCGGKLHKTSELFCGRHNKSPTSVAIAPPPPGKSHTPAEDELDDIIFKINKHGKLAYGKTGLILKSDTERYIIGRQSDDGVIVDLDDECIAMCKRLKFRFKRNYSKTGKKKKKKTTTPNEAI